MNKLNGNGLRYYISVGLEIGLSPEVVLDIYKFNAITVKKRRPTATEEEISDVVNRNMESIMGEKVKRYISEYQQ